MQGQADAVYLSSCDVPFLKPAFVRRLIELVGEQWICVPRVGDYHHPLAAVYRLEVRETIRRLLAEDRLRPFFLFESVPTRIVEASELAEADPTFQTLHVTSIRRKNTRTPSATSNENCVPTRKTTAGNPDAENWFPSRSISDNLCESSNPDRTTQAAPRKLDACPTSSPVRSANVD